MKISLVIPAHNEEKRIKKVLELYISYFSKNYSEYEIIVICDGYDDTAKIVRNISNKNNYINLFKFTTKLGKGGGIIEGFKRVTGEIIGFIDADGSVNPSDFGKLITELEKVDCAIASRRLFESKITKKHPLKRRVSSRVFNILVNIMFGLGIKDTQCGAKVFKKDVIKKVLPKIKSRGFEFDVELLWRIKREGFLIKEVPIEWQHKDGSTFSLKYAPEMFVNLLKRRFGK